MKGKKKKTKDFCTFQNQHGRYSLWISIRFAKMWVHMHTCIKLTIKDFIGTFLGSIWTTNYGNKLILNIRSLDIDSCEKCLGPEVLHTLVFLEYMYKHSEVTLGMGPKSKHRIHLCFTHPLRFWTAAYCVSVFWL